MLSRSGWAAVVSGVVLVACSAALGYLPLAVLGFGALAGVAVSLLWVLYRPRYIVRRSIVPNRVVVGDPSRSTLIVENGGQRRSLPLVAVERVAGAGIEVPMPQLAPGASHEADVELPTDRRAIIQVGPFEATRADPFGFVHVDQRFGEVDTLFVHPRHHALVPMPTSLERSLDGPTADAASGTQVFHALREYVAGDDRRLIHWRTSARTGTLMVRQHVDTTLPDLVVILDTSESSGTPDAFEEAVEVVASIAVACVRQGFPIRVRTSDGADFDPQGHPDPATFVLDRLAGVEQVPDASLVNLTEAMRHSRGGLALVVVGAEFDLQALQSISRLGRSFRSVTAVDLSPAGAAPPAAPGVQLYRAESAAAFAGQWNSGVVR